MRRSPRAHAGFVNHAFMGAWIGLLFWIGFGVSVVTPVISAGGGAGAVPILVWIALVAGLVLAVVAGFAACEGNLFLQLIGLGIAMGVLYAMGNGSDPSKTTGLLPAILAGMIPSAIFFAKTLISG